MTEHCPQIRRCQVPGCGYQEERGARQGDFANGSFVCRACAVKIAILRRAPLLAPGSPEYVEFL